MAKSIKIKHPKHVQSFHDNLAEVDLLMDIHIKIAGPTRGRKANLETLNKSAIVLLTACWESFIEDLLSASFDYLMSKSTSYKTIPSNVLKNIANQLKNDKHELKIWELSDTGWKKILLEYKDQILFDKLDYFHVPRPDKIDDLFKQLLGLNNITSKLTWKKMSNNKVKLILNNFIDIRGAIAHKVKTSKSIQKKDVLNYIMFLNRIGIILHNEVNDHLSALSDDISPWDYYVFNNPKT